MYEFDRSEIDQVYNERLNGELKKE